MQDASGITSGEGKAHSRQRRGGKGPGGGPIATERPPEFTKELWACIHCNYCTAECPTAREVGWESTTPRGRIRMWRSLTERYHPRRGVAVPQAFIKAVYECTSCGRCSDICHVGIDYLHYNEELRRWLARSGCGPLEDHKVLVNSLRNYSNPYLSPRRERARWAEGLDLPTKGDVLYFAGCSDSYVHPEVARRTVQVLRELGHQVAYLGADEPCCGSTAARLGLDGAFRELADQVVEQLAGSGASIVVTACPGCSSAFREYYPKAGIDPGVEVLHVTELLDRALEEGRLKVSRRLPGRHAWYDPCHLGRIDGVTEQPRRVLAACVEQVVELPRNRGESLCCGSGGGLKTAFPDQATSIGTRVVDLARDVGVGTLVTSCPWCETNLSEAALVRDPDSVLPVLDLVDVVHRALGLDGDAGAAGRRSKAPGRLV